MDTSSILYEVENIDKEINRLKVKITGLNTRKKSLMNQAINNIKDSDTDFFYNGKKISIKEKAVYTRKNEKRKKQDTLNILRDEGISNNPDDLYNKITYALKGQQKTKISLNY